MLRLRAPLSNSRRPAWRLQGALQPRWEVVCPWGYVGGVQCDPIEKKPFFHAYPGALAYSFGMLGCDLHCGYCQNWVTSQALRDPECVSLPMEAHPRAWCATLFARVRGVLVSTYNEPLITANGP